MFRGEFVGLNGGADFYAYSVEELKKEGFVSLVVFLDECHEDEIEPYKTFSGKATTPPDGLTPERHQTLVVTAQAHGVSIMKALISSLKSTLKRQRY